MSNSSRIEAATRQHVGAVLSSEQIVELVKLADPSNTKGVYPSDVAYKRTPEGLVPRGKTAYGDGVLELVASNQYKVLPTEEIVRRKITAPSAATPPAPPALAEEKKESKDTRAEEKPAKQQKKAAQKKLKKTA